MKLMLALVVVSGIGMMFSTTRQIAILSLAVLCLLFPVLVVLLALIGAAAFIVYTLNRKKS